MRSTLTIVMTALLAPVLYGCEHDTACDANCDVGNTREPNNEVDGGQEAGSDEPGMSFANKPEVDSGSEHSNDPPSANAVGIADGGADTTDNTDAANDAGALKVGAPATELTEAGNAPVEPDAGQSRAQSDGGTAGSSAPGASRGIECERVCTAAAVKGCGEFDACVAAMCAILDVEPECAPEANVYMACVAASDPESDFECREDGIPQYTSLECNDPYLYTWRDCLDRVDMQR